MAHKPTQGPGHMHARNVLPVSISKTAEASYYAQRQAEADARGAKRAAKLQKLRDTEVIVRKARGLCRLGFSRAQIAEMLGQSRAAIVRFLDYCDFNNVVATDEYVEQLSKEMGL